MKRTIAEVAGDEHGACRLGLYFQGNQVFLEYDGYLEPDDSESQLFIRESFPVEKWREGIKALKQKGKCSIDSLGLKSVDGGKRLELSFRKSYLNFSSPVDWTIEQLTICATIKSSQLRPSSSRESRTIASAFVEYSGEQTALSMTPSPIFPARRRPVVLVAGIKKGM